MSKIKAAFEISPLFEEKWSGIPIVTAQIAKHSLLDMEIDWIYLYENIVVPKEIVEVMLIRRSGAGLLPALEKLVLEENVIAPHEAAKMACIWPNIKSISGSFRNEAVIVHDLSTLLTPEFHHPDTINHHAPRIRHDVATSQHVFCDSSATRGDVISYLGVQASITSVLPLGVEYDLADLYEETCYRQNIAVEKYIVVLGTIEPRKNGSIVIELLARYPELTNDFKIVFVGRDGWLEEKQKLLKRLEDVGGDLSRVIFTGFVDDRIKLRLLLNAEFVIYPSFFEGFGLPVLECTVLGKICVASDTSSIPEVAPERSFFFDPTRVESLKMAVSKATQASVLSRHKERSFFDICKEIDAHSWKRCYTHLKEWIKDSGETT